MSKKATAKKPAAELPPDVQASDVNPKYDPDASLTWEDRKALLAQAGSDQFYPELTFYRTEAMGWVLTTLNIAKSRSRTSSADRTYGITVKDEKLCRVGSGPHVLQTVRVQLNKKNLERLSKYVDLWRRGMEMAGTTRDRISSRRAQGQVHRAEGRTSWIW